MNVLSRLGIRLEAHGDRLRYCPKSCVTPALAARMKAHKHDLLAHLRGESVEAEPGSPAAPDIDVEAIHRWLDNQVVPQNPQWCPRYGHLRGWRSIYGPHLICAICSPPAFSDIVEEYVEYPGGKPSDR